MLADFCGYIPAECGYISVKPDCISFVVMFVVSSCINRVVL